jgi:hypothetical protein
MKKPSVTGTILILLGVVVSLGSLLWLLSFQAHSGQILARLGLLSAMVCSVGMLVLCWGASVALLARWRKWSPRTCYLAGSLSLLLLPAAFLMLLDGSRFSALLIVPSSLAGYVCRKLAHPELTEEQATALEPPLSLFPR